MSRSTKKGARIACYPALAMDNETLVAIIGILPQLLLLLAVAVFAIWYHEPLGTFLATRVGSVSAFGLRVELRASDVQDTVNNWSRNTKLKPDEMGLGEDAEQISERARRLAPQLAGRTILWVDDHPEWNHRERRLLRKMGVFVDIALSNDEAIRRLEEEDADYDAVISDIKRDKGPSGLELLTWFNEPRQRRLSLIYYVGRPDERGTPAGAYGICYRPDVLMGLVMDVLDRLPEGSKESRVAPRRNPAAR
jgi:CheY-like chemotaxis protein